MSDDRFDHVDGLGSVAQEGQEPDGTSGPDRPAPDPEDTGEFEAPPGLTAEVGAPAPPDTDGTEAPDEADGTRPPDADERGRNRFGWYARLSPRARIGLWVLLGVWAALGAFFLVETRGDDRSAEPGAAVPDTEPDLLLIGLRLAGDAPPGFLLLHAPEAGPSSVVSIPAGTIVEIPGRGPASIESGLVEAGPDAVGVAVANVLGIHVPPTSLIDRDTVAALVDVAGGQLTVDVPETVEVTREGSLRTLATQGEQTMSDSEFLSFLEIRVPGEQELERLPRQTAALRALLSELSGVPASRLEEALAGVVGEPGPRETARLLAEVAGSNARFLTLPVTRSQAPEVVLYDVVSGEGLEAVTDALGDARSTPDDPIRVRLLAAASGDVAVPVAHELVDAGYRIVLTGRADRTFDVTRVVMAENTDELREIAGSIRDLVGMGRLGVYAESQTVFDVTLFVGRDWAEANGFPQSEPTPVPSPNE